MSERTQLLLVQIFGSVAVAGIAFVAYLIAGKQPALAIALTTLVSGLVGKLIGLPLNFVTVRAVSLLPPKAADEVVKRLTNRPPPPNA